MASFPGANRPMTPLPSPNSDADARVRPTRLLPSERAASAPPQSDTPLMACLSQAAAAKGVACLALLVFCTEGDNVPEAVEMALTADELLGVLPSGERRRKRPCLPLPPARRCSDSGARRARLAAQALRPRRGVEATGSWRCLHRGRTFSSVRAAASRKGDIIAPRCCSVKPSCTLFSCG